MKLRVAIEKLGYETCVGTIEGNNIENASFSYLDEYILNGGNAISLSLPLSNKPFSPETTRTYFEGPLPEGFPKSIVANYIHADENDYISIISALGRESIGALRVISDSDTNQLMLL